METADNAATGVTPLNGLVVCSQNEIAGTANGAEERDFRLDEQVEVAQSR
jgi:hypothetical protein